MTSSPAAGRRRARRDGQADRHQAVGTPLPSSLVVVALLGVVRALRFVRTRLAATKSETSPIAAPTPECAANRTESSIPVTTARQAPALWKATAAAMATTIQLPCPMFPRT